ncbi:hypothetical protein [Candidatus Albibeggiatoa sp. nov. NOAA]|uniref:hypothetical protein n=1 Tax=Candidatus Albibeggiatoa sp. nov. NOAA TaxID=3162724 RepID=UPI0032FCB5B6|nr:hypothetical protein [Thiotrichaceae bacterium]
MKIGKYQDYYWLVSSNTLWNIAEITTRFHCGLTLGVTCFDSGALIPTEAEIKQGWHVKNAIMLSPPLTHDLVIPCDQYDEWYISGNLSISLENIEIFVNYGGFSLEPAKESTCLKTLQNRFWNQINIIKPETYVATGDNDIVVSRNAAYINAIKQDCLNN